MNRKELTEAKRQLYLLLLKMKESDMDKIEVEIMWLLAKDKDIHNILKKRVHL